MSAPALPPGAVIFSQDPRNAFRTRACFQSALLVAISLLAMAAGALAQTPGSVVTIPVDTTNAADNQTSLREAVAYVSSLGGSQVITFAASLNGQAILLSQGQIEITTSLTFSGNGEANTIIDGNNASRLFHITAGGQTFNDLTLRKGRFQGAAGVYPQFPGVGQGGAIEKTGIGSLELTRCSLCGNTAKAGCRGGYVPRSSSSGGASGGAINAQNTLLITRTTFSSNSAYGSPGTYAGAGGGGAVSVAGNLVIDNSTFTSNLAQGGALISPPIGVGGSAYGGRSVPAGEALAKTARFLGIRLWVELEMGVRAGAVMEEVSR